MTYVRRSTDGKHTRTIGFRAWHRGLRQMVHVSSANFDSMTEPAVIVLPGNPVAERAQMKELVLLQDTNSFDASGHPVFEGDIIVVELQNQFGSMERAIGEVIFDPVQWGYNVKLYAGSGLPLTGQINVLDIIGNVFQGIDETKRKNYAKQARAKGNKK